MIYFTYYRGEEGFLMTELLKKTAWPMSVPKPYSLFHIVFCLSGIALAVLGANYFARKYRHNPSRVVFVMFLCGIFLSLGEIYKQLFLYVVVNQGRFDWWYFPFQLCSTPMYCLSLL